MHPFPHRYVVRAVAGTEASVIVESGDLPALRTEVPPEFGSASGRWSPETLLVAAIADCYALTFRGLAQRSKLPWVSLACEVAGTLDRVERTTKFTEFHILARLQVPEQASREEASRLLVKAEETCLVTRSLSGRAFLDASVETVVERVCLTGSRESRPKQPVRRAREGSPAAAAAGRPANRPSVAVCPGPSQPISIGQV